MVTESTERRAVWGVRVNALFAIVAWAVPFPDRWKPLVGALTGTALVMSCLCWLAVYLEFPRRQRQHPQWRRVVELSLVALAGATLAVVFYLLLLKSTTERPLIVNQTSVPQQRSTDPI